MPANVVRTPEDGIICKRAKSRAHIQYPEATGDHFYRLVMVIYRKMAHYSSIATETASAARRMR
jgi:hypothetical protein